MIISGKEIAEEIQQEIKKKILSHKKRPGLTMILVGHHPPSHSYVQVKKRACENVGIVSKIIELPNATTEEILLKTIRDENQDPDVDGILVQSPLPSHLTSSRIYFTIEPSKDVDGFHPLNMGKLFLGDDECFVPCTPLGILELLIRSKIKIEGVNAVIVGRSNIVGKPMAALLVKANATVTIAHSKSQNLKEITKKAGLLIAAIGKPAFIKAEMVGEGACVIDVGINRIEDKSNPKGYRIVGDVDFEEVAPKASAITPVPKGVGPMTVAMLLSNTLQSFERRVRQSLSGS